MQIKNFGIKPKKGLGQNFLRDENILLKEIKFANISKEDIVLEIGAGIGNLTEHLAKNSKKVIVIEKDNQFK